MTVELDLSLFMAAVLVLLVAHVVRCYRQTLLFPDRMLPWRFDLLLGLALSHVCNVLIAWRAGDLVRIAYVALRYRIRGSYVAATVIAERLSDVVVVIALAACTLAGRHGSPSALMSLAALLLVVAVLMIALALLIAHAAGFRRLCWKLASFFNDSVRLFLIDTAWSYSQLVTGRSMLRKEFLLLTAAMWSAYIGSYALFAWASQTSLTKLGLLLLGGPNRSLLGQMISSGVDGSTVAIVGFAGLPIVAVILYGLVRNWRHFENIWAIRRHGFGSLAIERPIAGDAFTNREDYGAFLQSHFAGTNSLVSNFGLLGSQDVVVVRLLPGGSDAVTAMIEESGVIRIRKCATGDAGNKLAEQAAWLRGHSGAFPLAEVTGERRAGPAYFYDMPYLLSARDFFEVIHTSPVEMSSRILGEVVDSVDAFHRKSALGDADPALVEAYLQQKVKANAAAVHAFASVVFPDNLYRVNGVDYHLDEWQRLFDIDWLRAQIVTRGTSVIHGDLTIENIIVSSEVERGWYVIDPNPANVFNTPLIDWAKLMQSLHLGYEGLNRSAGSAVRDNGIDLLFLRSSAYASLHRDLSTKLEDMIGPQAMREVAFHELVNYLRLTPYKIRHQPRKALTFFACTSVLLRRYIESVDSGPVTYRPSLPQTAGGSAAPMMFGR